VKWESPGGVTCYISSGVRDGGRVIVGQVQVNMGERGLGRRCEQEGVGAHWVIRRRTSNNPGFHVKSRERVPERTGGREEPIGCSAT